MMYERCNTEECDAGCSGPRDVLFLIHQTTYMGSMFDDIAKFYSQIIRHINIEPSESTIRFALSLYNTNYIPFFDFVMLNSLEEYGWAFETLPKARASSNYIGNALKFAAQNMEVGGGSGRRRNAPGVVVMLTDSTSSDEYKDWFCT